MGQNTSLSENQYLLNYRYNVASQFGEDGIIEKIFSIIPEQNHWCAEFGVWDGKFLSNTYNLIANKGWFGILIEADKKRAKELIENTYKDNKRVIPFNLLVGFKGENTLDHILSKTPIPQDFDLLSIDIDGNDYHVWDAVTKYKPKVVVIEFNPLIPIDIEFIQAADFKVIQGTSVLSLTKLAKKKGYELICVNQENAFYVDRRYFNLFQIRDNTIRELIHYKSPFQVFQLDDGTIVVDGVQALFYYNFPCDFNKKFQILPKYIRDAHIPWGGGNILQRFILRLFRIPHRIPSEEIVKYYWSWKESYANYNRPLY